MLVVSVCMPVFFMPDVLLACSCCCSCCWLTWTTIYLYELIHCCLEQPLVPLRIGRPCKTQILCWMSNTNELLNILTLPPGNRQQGLMEQFHSAVVRHQQCQFLNQNRAFLQNSAYVVVSTQYQYSIVFEIEFESHFDDQRNQYHSNFYFHVQWAFRQITQLVLLELTRHLVCAVMCGACSREVLWSRAEAAALSAQHCSTHTD